MQTQAVSITDLTLNTIRGLAMDAVQAANSGHPGMPMGAAAMGYAVFSKHLRFDPGAPKWHDRDRFILSAGHGSMLLYSLLHLTGYDLPLEELKNFRQWGSATPGHPENILTPGVEMATGPLGQGFGTAVGMAIAEEKLRAEFPGHFDHWTYCICSDGDLMEGVSYEAASLAGHLRLGRLVYLFDSNRITIDGGTDLAWSDDVRKRFDALGWHVLECDGHSVDEVNERIAEAKQDERPSLIICNTIIGYGSPNKAGTEKTHGSPLGVEEVRLSKLQLGLPPDEKFYLPNEVLEHMREIGRRHREERLESEARLEGNPELKRRIEGRLPQGVFDSRPTFDKPVATRAASGKTINALAELLPELIGGSADLTESTQTEIDESGVFSDSDRTGRNLHFGVREHAMGCALNGMTLHGGLRAFGGTFLIFSDYMRPTLRLAGLMEAGTIFVYTHDSIGLGEDGPTHQPIEHLAALRAVPNLRVIRPADANETVTAWKVALESRSGPTALVLTRQALPLLSPADDSLERGGYVLREASSAEPPRDGLPSVILIGTGSEVEICVAARELLEADGVPARVVSMPCWELFMEQSQEYRDSVLPPDVRARVSVEAAATLGWERWIGSGGVAIGIDHFGASAPFKKIYEEFGLTPERVAAVAKGLA